MLLVKYSAFSFLREYKHTAYWNEVLSATGQYVPALDTWCSADSFILHQPHPILCVCVFVCMFVFHSGRKKKNTPSLWLFP